MSLKNGSTAIFANSYGYSSATGRMATVGDGTYTAHYTWQDGTGLMAQNQIKRDSDSSVITTHNRTYGSRLSNYNLLSVSNTTGAATRAYSYVYNTKDQRTRMTLPDGAYWEYAYDDKGQVISGVKKDAAGNVIPGQSYGYNYDGIGNRNTTKHGMFGNQDTDAITKTYTSNSVNQYTQITTPGIAPVVGEADTDTKVKVIRNDSNAAASGEQVITTDRDGVYFMGMFKNVDNSNSAQTIPYTVYAIKTDYNNNKQFVQKASSSYTVPKRTQAYTYDDDGNMLTNGDWSYTWNGENRKIAAEKSDMKLEFVYDFMGRRISKKVYTGSVGNWTLASEKKFVYNGYKQIAEFDSSDALQKTYTWQPVDLDVPLWVKDGTNYYYYIVDGNKNVRVMVDSSGTLVAEYDYNPFGKVVLSKESYASTNKYRFSSEYHDDETGLGYYNYRYYDVELGRWLSRDPIGEYGGENLCGFVANNPIYWWDYLGWVSRPPAGGHHIVPFKFIKNFGGEAQKFLNSGIGMIKMSNGHNYSRHNYYNKVVEEIIEDFLRKEGIKASQLTTKGRAKKLLGVVKKCEFVREFNKAAIKGPKYVREWFDKEGWKMLPKSIKQKARKALLRLAKKTGNKYMRKTLGKVAKVGLKSMPFALTALLYFEMKNAGKSNEEIGIAIYDDLTWGLPRAGSEAIWNFAKGFSKEAKNAFNYVNLPPPNNSVPKWMDAIDNQKRPYSPNDVYPVSF